MVKENNAKCKREQCAYEFYSRIIENTGKTPKQCPKCKRYGAIEKI